MFPKRKLYINIIEKGILGERGGNYSDAVVTSFMPSPI
jgi:hypothetical protein